MGQPGKVSPEHLSRLTIFRVAVDALSLSLTPADPPCAVARRGGNGYNAAYIILAKIGKLQNEHAPHGTSDDGCYLFDSKVVQEHFEDAVKWSIDNTAVLMLASHTSHRLLWWSRGTQDHNFPNQHRHPCL